jgi:methylmalonyl-CoA mutase
VLLEESNLAKVADPAAGSGAIEHLTDALCATAWSLIQQIDAAGGAWAALESGLIQREVAAVRREREAAVAKRKDAITGTSDYPNLEEVPAAVLDVAPAAKAIVAGATIEPLPSIRLAAPFEALRDRSDTVLAESGVRPKVFLANLGKPPAFTARATFARNFYEAGGIAAVTNDGFKSIEEMVAAFKACGARLACLCSSDKVYATDAAKAAQALAAPGAIVHLAGRPGELEAALTAAGVKSFIYMGCDVLATLRATHDILKT